MFLRKFPQVMKVANEELCSVLVNVATRKVPQGFERFSSGGGADRLHYYLTQLVERRVLRMKVWDAAALKRRSQADLVFQGTNLDRGLKVWTLVEGEHPQLYERIAQAISNIAGGRQVDVIVTDSYVRRELADFDRNCRRELQTWCLVNLYAPNLWVGPVFGPHARYCWECLVIGLTANNAILRWEREAIFLRRRKVAGSVLRKMSESTELLHRWSVSTCEDFFDSQSLAVFSDETGTCETHLITPRSGCKSCLRAHSTLPTLDQPILTVRDMITMRERFVKHHCEALRRRVSQCSGLAYDIKVTKDTRASALFVATVEAPAVLQAWMSPNDESRSARGSSTASSLEEAELLALIEHFERYSGRFHGNERVHRGALQDFGGAAIQQALAPRKDNFRFAPVESEICDRGVESMTKGIDEHSILSWSPVLSLATGEARFIPSALLFSDHPECQMLIRSKNHQLQHNGLASGVYLEDAIAFALLELIERDAASIWWHNRLNFFPAVMPAGVQSIIEDGEQEGWVLRIFDITADIPISTYAACLSSPLHSFVGLGCFPDAELAAKKAVEEVYRSRKLLQDGVRQIQSGQAGNAFSTLTTEVNTTLTQRQGASGDCLGQDEPLLGMLVKLLAARGLEAYVADLSREECIVKTVRAVVPGLRGIHEDYAAGRLFDVPVELGWIPSALKREEMNDRTLPL